MEKLFLGTMRTLVFVFGVLFASNAINLSQATYAQEATPQFLYGIAAWYGDDFAGKQTASGEMYSPTALTAAHRSLPFGTKVEVENLSNGRKIQVIINDRGPAAQNRILDLSKQAAEALGMLEDGTTFVKATVVELGSSTPAPVQAPANPVGQDIVPASQASPATPVPTQETPAQATPPAAAPVTSNTALLDQDLTALFADADQELAFMDDDEFSTQPSDIKTQELPGMGQQYPSAANDVMINDPLADLSIGEEDEFVAAQLPPESVLNTAPKAFNTNTPAEADPFADLFDQPADPAAFQRNVVAQRETVTVTNYLAPITNVVTLPASEVVLTNFNASTPPAMPSQLQGDNFIVQVGAFSKQKLAMDVYEKLRRAGLNAFITDVKIKGKNLIRVRVGYFKTMDEAVTVSQSVADQFQLESRIIKVEY
ncbi:MAG: septal ring lytic transglycosylase RlpA family protein [Brevinema sp.]